MSPLCIHFLLYMYTHARTEDWIDSFNIRQKEIATEDLLRDGMISRATRNDMFILTDKGRLYAEYITTIPLPVHEWKIPDHPQRED